MPLPLVIDACAMLHAKQLNTAARKPAITGIALFDDLVKGGVELHTTKAVFGEQVQMSLSAKLYEWQATDSLTLHAVRMTEVREIKNKRRKKDPEPGRSDIALIALARKIDAILLTHDEAAALLADRSGVVTVDLLDLADLAVRMEWRSQAMLNPTFEAWNRSAWRSADWAGSAVSTLQSRVCREVVQGRMVARLDCGTTS